MGFQSGQFSASFNAKLYFSFIQNDHLGAGKYVNDGFTPVCAIDDGDNSAWHAVVLVKMRNYHFICKNSYIEEKTLHIHLSDKNPQRGYFIKLSFEQGLNKSKLSKLKTAYQKDEI